MAKQNFANSRRDQEPTLSTLFDKLADHQFALEAESFHDLFAAIEADHKLFHDARAHGIEGVVAYVEELRDLRNHIFDEGMRAGEARARQMMANPTPLAVRDSL